MGRHRDHGQRRGELAAEADPHQCDEGEHRARAGARRGGWASCPGAPRDAVDVVAEHGGHVVISRAVDEVLVSLVDHRVEPGPAVDQREGEHPEQCRDVGHHQQASPRQRRPTARPGRRRQRPATAPGGCPRRPSPASSRASEERRACRCGRRRPSRRGAARRTRRPGTTSPTTSPTGRGGPGATGPRALAHAPSLGTARRDRRSAAGRHDFVRTRTVESGLALT